ncbi:hypothetical protein MSG28_001803 [Choristoneura fumiferana]|uniref:Uncharacterized protein n=1 Tax=Choristoneura fumiferana TaxID=7141 RepID=A0ACC0KVG8_CHOFU|nr:hypothetical protein MSG28_001803 [Choristoneura fumiferana]
MGQVIQSPVEERVGCVGDDNNHTPGVHRQRKRRAVPGLRRGAGRLPRLRTLPEEDAPPTAPASPASLASLALAPVASPCADKDSYQRASTNFDPL